MKISNSSIGSFLTCPRKYKLNYIDKFTPKEGKEALQVGSAVHLGVDMYSSILAVTNGQVMPLEDRFAREFPKGFPFYIVEDVNVGVLTALNATLNLLDVFFEQSEFFSTNDITLQYMVIGLVEGYIQRHPEQPLHCELDLLVDIGSHQLRGIIDRVEKKDGKTILIDLKTAGKTPDFDKYKSQVAKYMYLYEKVTGDKIDEVYIHCIVKPGIRQKAKESIEEFRIRMIEECKQDKYFLAQRIRISSSEVADEIVETLEATTLLQKAVSENLFPKCKSSCDMYGKCEFYDICNNTENWQELYYRSNPRNIEGEIDGMKEDINTILEIVVGGN